MASLLVSSVGTTTIPARDYAVVRPGRAPCVTPATVARVDGVKWALLDGVSEEDVRALLSIARRRKFARGEVVFHEGDPADTLHLIDKGRFGVRTQTALGDTAILSVLGPGDMFGELALLDVGEPQPRSATVSALEAAETRSVHRMDFERLRREHPETTSVLIGILSGQVRRLSRHLLEALYVSADKR